MQGTLLPSKGRLYGPYRADAETCRRLRNLLAGLEIEPVLASLLDTLKEAVLIVGASVGGAVGAGLGSLFDAARAITKMNAKLQRCK